MNDKKRKGDFLRPAIKWRGVCTPAGFDFTRVARGVLASTRLLLPYSYAIDNEHIFIYRPTFVGSSPHPRKAR